ncbi:serine hydroxymethyltransferase [Alphaproteobacteria bacterium endosymbiont of Tiliacea citrago]|uniref:serine hydroxymethyltransferase n=1 Tax=Alphaproteobacteria bacterium endosymbiont of Tiliacea citrago TaxID=3077944 RepID=UPI00313DCB5B
MKKRKIVGELELSPAQKILEKEVEKQKKTISLIASENITSKNVREALSSVFTNKYAEGYPNARYYSGCEFADEIESYCIKLAKDVFQAKWANVQPHSGAQANQAVYLALLNKEEGKKDTILSLSLEAGGHLTHGAKVSLVGQIYNCVHYSLDSEGLIDMKQVEALAKQHKPKLIIAGASAYSRNWDWKKFREIADSVDAYLMVDMAHIAGIVAAGECENPVKHAHVVTSTTHKTLRGPRGGVILSQYDSSSENTKFKDIGSKIDKALFPGIQGGPLVNNIGAKAVAFEEMLTNDYKLYIKSVLKNSKKLADIFMKKGAKIVSGGTDNHLFIFDCRAFGMSAIECEKLLEQANIWVSKSALIGDSWKNPNGIRLGTPYICNLIDDITEFGECLVETLFSKDPIPLRALVSSITSNSRILEDF